MNRPESSMDRIATLVSCSSACPRSIGAVLIDAGRLSIFEAEQILRRQKSRAIALAMLASSLGYSMPKTFALPWPASLNIPIFRLAIPA